jgi:hypothetical protein
MAEHSDDELRDSLCDAAVAYAAGGWSILPTRGPGFEEPVCLRPPVAAEHAFGWWSDRAYGIACRTGDLFDTVAVSAELGRAMLPRLVAHHLPVLRVFDRERVETWHFLVTPGSPRIADLPRASPVRLIGRGGCIPLPPTPIADVAVRWLAYEPGVVARVRMLPVVTPELVSLRTLPHSLQLQWAALRTLTAMNSSMVPESGVVESTLRVRLRLAYEQGTTVTELCQQTGRSPKYVRRLLRQAGAVLRHPGRRPGREPVWRKADG